MSEYMQGRILHVDQHLSNVVLNYRPMGFIADQVFPVVQVPKQSDNYVVFEQADLFRHEDTSRSRGTEANKIHSRISKSGFFCSNYALKVDVTLEDRINADPVFIQQFEEGRIMRVQDSILLDWEVRLAKLISNTDNVGGNSTPTNKWNATGAKPLNDILAAIDSVESSTGYRPNRVLFSGQAWQLFRRHRTVSDRANNSIVSGGGLYPSSSQIEELLECKIHVGNAWRNSAEEGLDINLQQIWGSNVLVYYAPDAASMETPSFGYFFRWAASDIPNMQVVRHPYDTRRHCHEVEIGYYQAEAITAKSLGYLVRNVKS